MLRSYENARAPKGVDEMTYRGNVSGTCALKAAGKGVVRGGEGRISARSARTQRVLEGLVKQDAAGDERGSESCSMAGVGGVVGS
jgi:hypothetical protein